MRYTNLLTCLLTYLVKQLLDLAWFDVVDTMYEEFLSHPRMTGVRGRAVWVHVDVPGQGKHHADLPAEYVGL